MGHKMLVIILVCKFCCVSELYKCSSPCFELWFVGLSHFLRCAIKNPYVPLVDTCIEDLFRRKAWISASNCYFCSQVAIPKVPQHLHLVLSTPREIRFRFLTFCYIILTDLSSWYLERSILLPFWLNTSSERGRLIGVIHSVLHDINHLPMVLLK